MNNDYGASLLLCRRAGRARVVAVVVAKLVLRHLETDRAQSGSRARFLFGFCFIQIR